MNTYEGFTRSLLAAAMTALLSSPVHAAESVTDLERRLEQLQQMQQQMQQQMRQLQRQIQGQKQTSENVDALEQKVAQVEGRQDEWLSDSIVHLAGYGEFNYSDTENADGSFGDFLFAPIFHYQYKDLMMLESELEITVNDAGETETKLEYLTLDLFLNDYMVLVGGRFLSPIGQFRQNLHPSWINKLPTAPPGFGHDGAAPISETGLQLRGGIPLGRGMFANYAVYVGNGPEILAEAEGAAGETDFEFELDGVEAEGMNSDEDGEKVFGGRLGLLPFPGLEIGISGATGKATVTELEHVDIESGFLGGTEEDAEAQLAGEPDRDYDVFGFDLAWQWRGLDLRGEYVKTEIGDEAGSVAADGAEWESWYTQAAYKFAPTKLEGVLRYTDFDAPHASAEQEQWMLGVNYLFASNVIAKFAYEFNDGQTGAVTDDDAFRAQLAYGF